METQVIVKNICLLKHDCVLDMGKLVYVYTKKEEREQCDATVVQETV